MTGNDNHPARRIAVQGALVACTLSLVLAASNVEAAKPETTAPPLAGVVNLNTASPEELTLLPGVGEVRAVAIVAKRKERGGFKDVDELLDIKGIGTSMLERMRPFVTLNGKTTARKL